MLVVAVLRFVSAVDCKCVCELFDCTDVWMCTSVYESVSGCVHVCVYDMSSV